MHDNARVFVARIANRDTDCRLGKPVNRKHRRPLQTVRCERRQELLTQVVGDRLRAVEDELDTGQVGTVGQSFALEQLEEVLVTEVG